MLLSPAMELLWGLSSSESFLGPPLWLQDFKPRCADRGQKCEYAGRDRQNLSTGRPREEVPSRDAGAPGPLPTPPLPANPLRTQQHPPATGTSFPFQVSFRSTFLRPQSGSCGREEAGQALLPHTPLCATRSDTACWDPDWAQGGCRTALGPPLHGLNRGLAPREE